VAWLHAQATSNHEPNNPSRIPSFSPPYYHSSLLSLDPLFTKLALVLGHFIASDSHPLARLHAGNQSPTSSCHLPRPSLTRSIATCHGSILVGPIPFANHYTQPSPSRARLLGLIWDCHLLTTSPCYRSLMFHDPSSDARAEACNESHNSYHFSSSDRLSSSPLLLGRPGRHPRPTVSRLLLTELDLDLPL
jgi:hypothetical protein